jgi:branched-chain amino acid transport system ATP-binding protein
MDSPARAFTAEQVSLAFGGVVALDEVDVELVRGQILGLIGPNGAGKTTLVNVLTGFQKPDSGVVRLDGREVTGEPPYQRARMGICRTFQGARVFSGLTVRENLEVACLRGRFSRRAAGDRATELMERIGLSPVAEAMAGDLGFGDERRLGMARALALEPAFLILDEPAAGLDEKESAELRESVAGIRSSEGCGVLLIEHDMALVMALCDTIQVLDFGRTIALGGPEEIRADQRVIDAYLGAPA